MRPGSGGDRGRDRLGRRRNDPLAGSPRVAGIASTLCGSHSSAGAYSRPPAPRAASGARSSVACSAVRAQLGVVHGSARGAGGPVFGLNVGTSGVGSSRPLRLQAGFLALERDFPGTTTDPAEIVVSNASSPATEEALETLRTTLAADPRFGEGEIRRSADGAVALLSVPVQGDPSDENAVAAVKSSARTSSRRPLQARARRSSSVARPRRTSTTSARSSTPRPT